MGGVVFGGRAWAGTAGDRRGGDLRGQLRVNPPPSPARQPIYTVSKLLGCIRIASGSTRRSREGSKGDQRLGGKQHTGGLAKEGGRATGRRFKKKSGGGQNRKASDALGNRVREEVRREAVCGGASVIGAPAVIASQGDPPRGRGGNAPGGGKGGGRARPTEPVGHEATGWGHSVHGGTRNKIFTPPQAEWAGGNAVIRKCGGKPL